MFSNSLYRSSLIVFVVTTAILENVEGQACQPGCQREINGIYDSIRAQRLDLNAANLEIKNLQKKITTTENTYQKEVRPFIQRISKWQSQVIKNFTSLSNRLESELTLIYDYLAVQIQSVKSDLNTKINSLTSEINYIKNNRPTIRPSYPTTRPGPGSIREVYWNVTERINNLEWGKIQNLTADNMMWRQNFRVINATFDRMKRNNCFC